MVMRPTVRVIDRDRGWRKVVREVAKKAYVEVGIRGETSARDPDAEGETTGMTNVWLALIHEFGTTTIPARSFIRSTIDSEVSLYRKLSKVLARKVYQGQLHLETALEILGVKIVADMRRTIDNGIEPPLAGETINQKGRPTPLIDTGQLKKSITYFVKRWL